MYCKYCGKPIDDDSKFCKTCGKSLANDNPYSNYSFPIGKIKPFYIPICLIVIWYAISFIVFINYCKLSNVEVIERIDSLVALWITPIIYYLIYTLLHKNKKYPLQLWNKEDKLTTKLIKISYIVYSCCLPLMFWNDDDTNVLVYLILMFFLWVIPSIFLYLIYLKVISFKYLVKSVLIISIITAASYGIGYYSYYFFNLPPKASAEEIAMYNKKGISSREEYSITKPKRLTSDAHG
jgi:hypothetical protein